MYPMPLKDPSLNETFVFKLPSALLNDVRQAAARSDRTVSAEIRHALKQHVARQREEGVAARR
jgi:predicted transcriptional regulator